MMRLHWTARQRGPGHFYEVGHSREAAATTGADAGSLDAAMGVAAKVEQPMSCWTGPDLLAADSPACDAEQTPEVPQVGYGVGSSRQFIPSLMLVATDGPMYLRSPASAPFVLVLASSPPPD